MFLKITGMLNKWGFFLIQQMRPVLYVCFYFLALVLRKSYFSLGKGGI